MSCRRCRLGGSLEHYDPVLEVGVSPLGATRPGSAGGPCGVRRRVSGSGSRNEGIGLQTTGQRPSDLGAWLPTGVSIRVLEVVAQRRLHSPPASSTPSKPCSSSPTEDSRRGDRRIHEAFRRPRLRGRPRSRDSVGRRPPECGSSAANRPQGILRVILNRQRNRSQRLLTSQRSRLETTHFSKEGHGCHRFGDQKRHGHNRNYRKKRNARRMREHSCVFHETPRLRCIQAKQALCTLHACLRSCSSARLFLL